MAKRKMAEWEPQAHGEWGDWALPPGEGGTRPYATRCPDGSVSLTLEARSTVIGFNFTAGQWRALCAIASGEATGPWQVALPKKAK